MAGVPPWFYDQSAVIPYRVKDGQPEILLITSRKRKRWGVPKGVIEPFLSPAESAAQEAWEEAGLVGRVSAEPVGSYRYPKWGGICTVQVFWMEVETVLEEWPEANLRQRRWMSPEMAARTVSEEKLAQLIRSLPGLLAA